MTSINVNYDGQSGAIDCTVSPAEIQQARAKDKQVIADQVAGNQEYQRVPKGVRSLKHVLVEEVYKDGATEAVKSETVTKRRDK